MKPEYQSRYSDLLTNPSDEALGKLVQELDTAYTAPTRPGDLSWEAAQRHLTLVSQRAPHAESSLPLVRPLHARTTRGWKVALLTVAAIVALAVLSTTLLTTVGIFRFQPGQNTSTSATLLVTDVQLLQQLVQDKGTPTDIQQLIQHGQFTALNVTSHTYDVHIQKVYADANNVVLLYTVDMSAWNMALGCSGQEVTTNTCTSEPVVTLKTSQGQTLPETAERANMGKEPVYKNKLVALLAYYDASGIQGNPTKLTLKATLSKRISPSQEKIGEFTTPVHTEKTIINVHQTVSSNGHALTLERVVITPTEARFYYSYHRPLASSTDSITSFADETISIAGKTHSPNPFPADNSEDVYGWFNQGSPNGTYTSFHEALQDQTGTWVFTERAVVDENLNGPPSAGKNIHYAWEFTFIVS